PPTVGSSFDDFWLNASGTWSTVQLNGGSVPGDFAARFGATVQAVPPSIVYDNTAVPVTDGSGNQLYYPSASEYGDEITLSGANRVLTAFDFYYYYSGVSAGSATAAIRFYKNDGPGGAPGTSFFTSDPITLNPGYRRQTINFSAAAGLIAPDSFTWTVRFSDLGANQAGLLVYGPPTVGSSPDDFWQNAGGAWSTFLINGGSVPSDFAGRFGATLQAVPVSIVSFSLANGDLTFRVSGGIPPLQLQVRPSLTTGSWVNYGAPFTNTTLTLPAPGGSQSFFRVVSQ
ncbi:MAG: hypothetical protein DME18_08190, partial [Verrucomicrobia bacterium]